MIRTLSLITAILMLMSATAARTQVALDMRGVDLRDFVQIVAESTGRNFIVDPRVSGTVTVVVPDTVSPQTVYEIFLNVLEINQLTIVEGEGADRIVPLSVARELSQSDNRAGRGGAYETRAIQVRNAAVTDIAEVVRPLIPADAVLSVVPSAGLLILSDRRENIDRIETLVASLDAARAPTVDTIRLEYGNAEEMVTVIEGLDFLPAGASLSADTRGNAIVVSGPSEFRTRIRTLVRQLDTPQRRSTTTVVQLNYATATELAEVVRQSFGTPTEGEAAGDLTVVAEPQSNALMVTAPQDRIGSIVDAIRALDQRPSQVLIEAVIFEISAENYSDLSAQFGGILNDVLAGGTQFSLDGRVSLTTLVSAAVAGQPVNVGSGATVGGVRETDSGAFGGFLSALARENSTRLLSTPSVLTLNNQEAEIVVAQNVPFVTGSFATVGDSAIPDKPFQTIQRQDVGLTLKVTPQITRDGTVRMAILQEVSNLTNTASAAGGEITARRMMSTNVIVGDGRVIMLGGLIEDSSRTNNQRVPGLGRAPVIGGLFRARSVQAGQRVLLVMLRPRVVSSESEAQELTRRHAREVETLSRRIAPRDDSVYPASPQGGFPFDGVDLNQPFDADFVDKVVRDRLFPALPSRLQFDVGQ